MTRSRKQGYKKDVWSTILKKYEIKLLNVTSKVVVIRQPKTPRIAILEVITY